MIVSAPTGELLHAEFETNRPLINCFVQTRNLLCKWFATGTLGAAYVDP